MGRYGVKISQQGIDISRAADYQKVLDSDWKFLDIFQEIDIDITFSFVGRPTGTYLVPLIIHALGHVAGYEFFASVSTAAGGGFTNARNVKSYIFGDDVGVYFQTYGGDSGRIKGKLRVYTINILEEYQAPTVYTISAAIQPPGKYGAKFLDLNRGIGNIEDENMEPFTLNTRGKQISIHKHGVATGSGNLEVTHNIGYPPSYMIAKITQASTLGSNFPDLKYSGTQVVSPLTTSFYLARPLNANTMRFNGVQTGLFGEYAYVILKDPMEIAG